MEFRFADPTWLWLLAALPALGLWQWLIASRWRATLRYSDLGLVQGIGAAPRRLLLLLPPSLRMAALSLLIVAMARPQSGDVQREVLIEGVDIMLVLDGSGSMRTGDFPPFHTRLDAAKEVIASFIEGRETDRIGMVIFGEESFTVCPLTVDYSALIQLLARVRPGIVPENGTAIGTGILNAIHRMRDSEAQSKVIILLTDGDNNRGIDPQAMAALAGEMGIKIYAIGIGPPGTRRQMPGFDPQRLEVIAAETKGRAYFAQDAGALQAIYDEIDQLETSEVEFNIYAQWDELMMLFLWPALACFALEILLRKTRVMTLP
jgi:Ca-activated chloride channel homolog